MHMFLFFFFNDTATTEIYTLSLHDALPIFGQGMGALLISPGGEAVLFDDGNVKDCDKPVSYLQQLGITKIDYHVTSHYHADHIGCAPVVFHDFPLQKDAFDRGSSYNSTVYTKYVASV